MMLARANRLVSAADYRSVVRRGKKCGGALTVVYSSADDEHTVSRFGFIVSKAVGNAVVRNTVRRRLKAVCFDALPVIDSRRRIVVRALPAAASASFDELRREVNRALGAAL